MPAQMIGGGRPMRQCIGCQQTDDHPKCEIDSGLLGSVFWHMDCHRISQGSMPCHPLAESADGATGQAMLDHILANSRKG